MTDHFSRLPFLRQHSTAVLMIVCGVFAVGCYGDDAKTNIVTKPFADQEIAVLVPAELGFEEMWDLSLSEWSVRTGARVQLHSVDLVKSQGSVTDAYGGSPRSDAEQAGNLILFPITDIAELAQAGMLASLAESQLAQDALNWRDLLKGLRQTIGSPGGKPAVLPISCPVLICYYRRDLLDQAGLAPPQTWQQYQKLLERLDQWAGNLTAVEPWGVEFRATMFLARAVSYAKHPGDYSTFFDISSGKPLINGPGFERALRASRSALKHMPAEVFRYDPGDCRRDFFSGKAALAIAYETGFSSPPAALTPARNHPVQDAVVGSPSANVRPEEMQAGFCRLPGAAEVFNGSLRTWEGGREEGVNFVTLTAFGGLCAGVTANSSSVQADAAWNLLTSLTKENIVHNFPTGTRTPCRNSQMAFADAWVGDELTAAEAGMYLSRLSRSVGGDDVVAELPVVGRAEFRRALTSGLTKALIENADPAEVLKEVADRWREISSAHGTEVVRDSYRRCLGLSPLSKSK